MQKIFDTDNKEDMKLLWNILPTNTFKIRGMNGQSAYLFADDNKCYGSISDDIIKINWRHKEEITRPIDYEDMMGCVGWFDGYGDEIGLGILTKVAPNDKDGYCFLKNNNIWCKTFRPAKKSELKFYGD